MGDATRVIGLSLGADLCWPACFEGIVNRLGAVTYEGETHRIEVERVTIEPFDLRQDTRYDVVLDRLTHWYQTSREWIKKAVLMDELYVFNNPWSLQAMEKHSSYVAMMRLGLPVPDTWMVPPKEYEPSSDLEPTLQRYARMFDLGQVGKELGYPMYMKPYDGGAWVGVSRIDDADQLQTAYEESGRRVMHLQRAAEPWDVFVRVLGVGPQTRIIRYDPGAPLHERYSVDFGFVDADEALLLEDMALTINSFFGWDFNSCEALRSNGSFVPIDFANACPGLAGDLAALPLPLAGDGQGAMGAVLRHHQEAHEDQPRLGRILRVSRPRPPLPGEPRRVRCHSKGSVRDRALRGVLRHDPGRPGRGGARLLRQPRGARGGPFQGRRPIPRTRVGSVHRPFLGAHPAVASMTTHGVKPERVHRVVLGQTGAACHGGQVGVLGHTDPRLPHRRW